MGVTSGSGRVFNWLALLALHSAYICLSSFRFVNMTAVAGLITWFAIAVTYIRFHKGLMRQGYDRSTLPFASKLQVRAGFLLVTFD
jgi:amino acid transporter